MRHRGGNLPVTSRHARALAPGLHVATKKLLRLGIILFGLSITLQQILGLGWSVVVLDVIIAAVLSCGYFLGSGAGSVWIAIPPC